MPILADRLIIESILEHAQFAVGVVEGHRHRLVFANGAFHALLGTPAANGDTLALGRPLATLCGEECEPILSALDAVWVGREAVSARECEIWSGCVLSYWSLEYVPLTDPDGEMSGTMVIGIDVTAEVMAWQRLSQSAQMAEEQGRQLEALAEHLPVGLAMVGEDGRVQQLAEHLRRLTGLDPADYVGRDVGELARALGARPAEGRADFPALRAARGEQVQDEGWLFFDAGGKPIEVMCTASPMRNRFGHPAGAILLWRETCGLGAPHGRRPPRRGLFRR